MLPEKEQTWYKNTLSGSLNPLAAEYGQLTADYENGRITALLFYEINKQQGIATAEAVGTILGVAGVVRNVAIEGASKGYRLYNVGRVGQIRIGTNRIIIRLDANKQITHINVGDNIFDRSFNFHFPSW